MVENIFVLQSADILLWLIIITVAIYRFLLFLLVIESVIDVVPYSLYRKTVKYSNVALQMCNLLFFHKLWGLWIAVWNFRESFSNS